MTYDFYPVDTRIHSVDCDRVEYCLYLGFVTNFLTSHETYLIIHVDIVFGRLNMFCTLGMFLCWQSCCYKQ